MKKTLIALMIVALLAAGCGTTAPEETEPSASADAEAVKPDSAMETDAPAEDSMPDLAPSYIQNQVTVTAVGDEFIETTIDPDDPENMENIINFLLIPDTLVYDRLGNKLSASDIALGGRITVYTDAYSPAPLILPPQYQANVIILDKPEAETLMFTHVNTFITCGQTLVDASNTLALNLSEETVVVDTEEESFDAAALAGKDLLVFYDVSTRSIPAQTTPLKVVVLGENQMALANINAA